MTVVRAHQPKALVAEPRASAHAELRDRVESRPQRREACAPSGGRPLPPTTRERLEAAFGVPLEDVRVHADAEGAELAEEHEAEALTLGRHIAFGRGRFSPETEDGARLLAHEVTHVVQQGASAEPAPAAQRPVSEPAEPVEREAERVAARAARGDRVEVAVATSTRGRILRRALASAAPASEPTHETNLAHAEPKAEDRAPSVEPAAVRTQEPAGPPPAPPQDAAAPGAEPELPSEAGVIEALARGPPSTARVGPQLAVVAAPRIQTKLAVSAPGDALEREAELFAARVLRAEVVRARPDADARRALPPIRGPPPPARDRDAIPAAVASVVAAPGGGAPLDVAVRERIEPLLGVDLGAVRVRRGPDAAAAARDLRARAFTSGATIFLAAESSPHDIGLMAHEATHVAQQRAVPAARTTLMRDLSDYLPDVSVSDVIPNSVLDGVRSTIRAIPGYTLLTYIVGTDPLTNEPVTVDRQQFIETLLTYGPFGAAVGSVLQTIDVLGQIFDFVTSNLAAHNLTLARITGDVTRAWNEMSAMKGIAGNVAIVRRYVDAFLTDVRAFVGSIVDRVIEIVRSIVADIAEPLLETPEIAPVWNLTKKVLHYDPLHGTEVHAPTVEIISDFLRLIGQEQRLAQMQERGTLQKTADWLDTQLATFASLVTELGSIFSDAWAAIQPQNLPDLMTNLPALAQRVFGFIQRVGDFATTLIEKVLELVKEALLGWLSENAHKIRGFHLLTVIIGENPVTGDPVPRTAENLIKGFVTLLPNGEATYQQLEQTGIVARAAGRIDSEMARLGISVEMITGLFHGIWDSLSLDDLLDPIGAFQRVLAQFGEPLSRLIEFIGVVLQVVIELVLRLMNFPIDLLGNIIANAQKAIEDIRRDPIAFFQNMLEAVKLGFTRFFDNILTYLAQGLGAWLFRGLGQLGIQIPTDFSLGSILTLVLQVLGITADLLWRKLGEHIGEERVAMIRGALDRLTGAWEFIKDVQENGISAVWRFVTDQLSNLWDTLLNMAKDWIMRTIVRRVTARLLSMLDPTGIMAVVNSFIAFFRAVQSAIAYLREILQIVDRYVSTLAAVAAGNILVGAQMLEQGLAAAIPIAIGFLANQVGLGDAPEQIVEIIQQLRQMVEQAIDWLIDQAIRLGQAALNALGLGQQQQPAPGAAGTLRIDEPVSLEDGGHRLQSESDPRELVLHTAPVALSHVADPELQKLYTRYVAAVTTYTANLAQFDDPQRAAQLGGSAEQPPAGARLGKSAVDAIVADIKVWVDKNGVPPTDAPGLGDVRPYAQQQKRFASIPIWKMEAEHVIPNGYFNGLLEGMRLRRIEHSDEYQQMSTVMIYERAAEWKTSGAGADEGDVSIIATIKTWARAYFTELHADGGIGGVAEENHGDLMAGFRQRVTEVESRTLDMIDEEQHQNGTHRGHAAGESMQSFFAPRVADVKGRQLRLFSVALDDRLHESAAGGRTAF